MTGINLDLFSVILLILLAFTWGYHGGKNVGREEMKRNVDRSIKSLTDIFSGKKNEATDEKEQLRLKLTKNPDGSNKNLKEVWNSICEEAKKNKDQEEDRK